HLDIEKKNIQSAFVLPSPKVSQKSDLKDILNGVGISSQTEGEVDDDAWVFAKTADQALKINERKLINGLVPDVTGMGLKDAVYMIENAGMRVRYSGSGKVRKQSLQPGVRIIKGGTIYIELK
ncbi:MAG TPA: PASTA domain-containing protein, partial [Bacteroidia bacterium]|nr:PASTA domain-containing protein [Bacteroidia bacterium]